MTDQPAPGWYSDPSGEHELRYWDGTAWTSLVASGGDVAEHVKGPDGSVLCAPASTVTPPLALDARRPPQPSTPVSVALRVVAWILGLGVSTFAGMMIGLIVANVLSDCGSKAGNAQHCFAPALTGAFFGTVGGFIFGIAAIVAFKRRFGHRDAPMSSGDAEAVEKHRPRSVRVANTVEPRVAQPLTASDVVPALVLLAMLVAFAMLAWSD